MEANLQHWSHEPATGTAPIGTVYGASFKSPPYEYLSVAKSMGNTESIEGAPANPKTVTNANMGPPIPKICHGLKVAIKPITYGKFDSVADTVKG